MQRWHSVAGREASPWGGLSRLCIVLLAAGWTRHAAAETTIADGFVHAKEVAGEIGCLPGSLAEEALAGAALTAMDQVGLDAQLAVVLTAGVLTCPSIFYAARKNDVHGIGYQRTDGDEVFDRDPGRALEGVAFLNDLPYWLDNPDELESAFLHEIGHRWLARVHADVQGEDVDLLGRQGGHWSYFLDSGGSPLEGNAWQDSEEPVAESPLFPTRYSALDLYLMGAYRADEVPPFRLLLPDDNAVDCTGTPLSPASPPQTCGPLALAGSWLPLTIDDVIAAEGPRIPAASDAPKQLSVAFLLLDPGGADFGVRQCEDLAETAEQLIDLFGEATAGRLSLVNAATGGVPCDELEFAPAPSAGCQIEPRSSGRSAGWLLLLGALVPVAHRSRTRRSRLPG
jgi:hypothetical protein